MRRTFHKVSLALLIPDEREKPIHVFKLNKLKLNELKHSSANLRIITASP